MHIMLHNLMGICLWNVIGIVEIIAAVGVLVVHFTHKGNSKDSSDGE